MSEVKNVRPKKSRKDIIKDIAIAFLTILLLLTFFSNTIMNYSLPEVYIQQIQEGTISPIIRGTGTVEAKDPYNVKVSQERVIKSVAVSEGAKVKKGDIIYYLEDKESTELTEAKSKLDDLHQTFETALFSGDLSNEAINRVRGGQTLTMDQFQAKLKAATDRYDAAKLADEQAQAAIDAQSQQQAYTAAQYNYDEATPQYRDADITYKITELDQQIEAAKADSSDSSSDTNSETVLKDKYERAKDDYSTAQKEESSYYDKWQEALADSKKEGSKNTAESVASLENAYNQKVQETKDAKDKLKEAEKKYKAAEGNVTKKSVNEELIAALEAEKNRLLLEQANGTKDVSQITTQAGQVDNDYQRKAASLQDTKNKTAQELDKATTERTELLTEIAKEIELDSQRDTIEEQKEIVAKLEKEAVGATITAPVDGTISELTLKAGESTNAENPVAIIQVEGKGMQTSFSVTMDQAKRLKVGDIAEPQNAWYYTDFKATLKSITADQQNPNTKKVLTFSIESPEVQNGQSVSLQIGQKSDTYDLTLPAGAIRQDNNGKYILIVKSKSSPLGNRYIASKVDVEVLGSDDTTAAVSGSLEGDEYVITTSTTLINPGDQVRLANDQ
ncbi:HlyD family efflux transporter periplasmic adaptor subunit [Butyrivibrio sp. LC3010]|uniref:HlyD family efflux transporter periplasmic adaptor subunit n=1 Tax=Butyrivibrio sp. LC3010 TaxID=1280680 RepID=UPI00041AC8D5|nr:HlyD family efflux transporter periplasmic adaptor subunit [Butyrivibrio sp. LC3010]